MGVRMRVSSAGLLCLCVCRGHRRDPRGRRGPRFPTSRPLAGLCRSTSPTAIRPRARSSTSKIRSRTAACAVAAGSRRRSTTRIAAGAAGSDRRARPLGPGGAAGRVRPCPAPVPGTQGAGHRGGEAPASDRTCSSSTRAGIPRPPVASRVPWSSAGPATSPRRTGPGGWPSWESSRHATGRGGHACEESDPSSDIFPIAHDRVSARHGQGRARRSSGSRTTWPSGPRTSASAGS